MGKELRKIDHNPFKSGLFGKKENDFYITKEDIDEFISSNDKKNINVGSIRQKEFDYFIEKSQDTFEGLQFLNLMVSNLNGFSKLKNINVILIDSNRKATKLWNMSNNSNLEYLRTGSCTKLRSIDEVTTAPKLRWYSLLSGVWPNMELNTLSPLANTNIEYLEYSPKKLHDLDFSFLTKMPKLAEVNFSLNYHTTEEIAWMKAKMSHIKGSAIVPYVKFNKSSIDDKDVCICGKRKPFLNSRTDQERIKKYTDKFWKLVEFYKNNDIEWRTK